MKLRPTIPLRLFGQIMPVGHKEQPPLTGIRPGNCLGQVNCNWQADGLCESIEQQLTQQARAERLRYVYDMRDNTF